MAVGMGRGLGLGLGLVLRMELGPFLTGPLNLPSDDGERHLNCTLFLGSLPILKTKEFVNSLCGWRLRAVHNKLNETSSLHNAHKKFLFL